MSFDLDYSYRSPIYTMLHCECLDILYTEEPIAYHISFVHTVVVVVCRPSYGCYSSLLGSKKLNSHIDSTGLFHRFSGIRDVGRAVQLKRCNTSC